jgi:hypothetical protein
MLRVVQFLVSPSSKFHAAFLSKRHGTFFGLIAGLLQGSFQGGLLKKLFFYVGRDD